MQCCDIVTDDTLRELKEHGSARFPFQHYLDDVTQFPAGSIGWHWHREMELVAVEQGEAYCLLGNTRLPLKAGDGVFINSGVIHSFELSASVKLPNILFAPEFIAPEHTTIHERFISPFLTSDVSHLALRGAVPNHRAVLDRLVEVCRLSAGRSPARELDIHAGVCRAWSLLYGLLGEMVTIGKAGSSMLTQARLRRMLRFMEAHYPEKIMLEDIAHAASVSKSEALRCFKTTVSASPVEYLNRYRLHRATALLCATENTVTDISAAVGFDSVGYFDRVFKKEFDMSPKAFRRLGRG